MSDAFTEPRVTGKPAPSRRSRWLILAVIGIASYGGYYAFDYIAPLAPLLSRQLHFSNTDIGWMQAVYSLPNIVAMLVCGVLIDRLGTRKSLSIFGVLVFIGLVVTALSPHLGVMVAGRLLVGAGGEALQLAANVGVARWFWNTELSLAYGLRASAARLGSFSAEVSPAWAPHAYTYWRWPLLIGVGFGALCLLGAVLYWKFDARGERRFTLGHTARTTKIPLREVFQFNKSFWLIAALCVTFYGCIFPFETFGQKFLIDARHVTPQTAALLVGMEPFFSLVGMPLFGLLVDRYAHRSLLMMFGSLLIVPVFPMLGFTNIPPAIPMAMMGVAFALVPAVMWPALVYVVDKSRLGLANGMLDTVQQAGLVIINLLIGWANDRWLASARNAAGYHAGLLMFTGIAVLAVLCAFALWRAETGPSAHGLETITTRL
ncbi:MAG TPA: MFS transporter [Candidatus Acidoferrales bacterium]|nr:MFS transporter [Candidatus Acidoferrales bacterium]